MKLSKLYDTKLIREFYVEHNHRYVKSPFGVRNLVRLLGSGMSFSEGQAWKHKRQIISKVFHFNFLNDLVPAITFIVNQILDQLPSNDVYFDLVIECQRISAEIIIEIFFSKSCQGITIDGKPISEALNHMLTDVTDQSLTTLSFLFGSEVYEYGILPSHRRLIRQINDFKKLGIRIIEERIAEVSQANYVSTSRKDLIETLLMGNHLVKTNSEHDGNKISYQELLDEFCNFLAAGRETTGHHMSNILYRLTMEPIHLEEISNQIHTYIKSDNDLTVENLRKITALQDFLNESLRFYGPGTGILMRMATVDHRLGPYTIKKGTCMTIGVLENCYNPKYFDNPTQFDPQRWKERGDKSDPYDYLPFSAGPRNCIGQHMVQVATKITIIQFIRRFKKLEMQPGYSPDWKRGLVYETKQPMLARIVQ